MSEKMSMFFKTLLLIILKWLYYVLFSSNLQFKNAI